MSLTNKVVLITGASSGIGAAVATHLASKGALLVINYRSNPAAAERVVEACGGPDRALAVQADASKLPDIDRLVAAAVEKFGRIDVAMANAGLMLMKDVEDTTENDFTRQFDTNVKGPYFLAQKVVPHMRPGSRIIFVSSGVCRNTAVTPNYLLYAATKGAIEQMTRLMAKGLASKGIHVNAVAPGPVATDLFFEGKPESLVNNLKGMNPFGRLGEGDDIARVVGFLSGEDSNWVDGHILSTNGGTFV